MKKIIIKIEAEKIMRDPVAKALYLKRNSLHKGIKDVPRSRKNYEWKKEQY